MQLPGRLVVDDLSLTVLTAFGRGACSGSSSSRRRLLHSTALVAALAAATLVLIDRRVRVLEAR